MSRTFLFTPCLHLIEVQLISEWRQHNTGPIEKHQHVYFEFFKDISINYYISQVAGNKLNVIYLFYAASIRRNINLWYGPINQTSNNCQKLDYWNMKFLLPKIKEKLIVLNFLNAFFLIYKCTSQSLYATGSRYVNPIRMKLPP